MGKAIFLNFPTHGCINSLLSTVSELVNRGQKIIYYCTEEFRSKIEQTGAEFRPYMGVINTFRIENDDLSKALELNVEMTVDKLEHNLEAIRKEDPDYIAHDSLCTWGKQMAAILRCPSVNLMHSFPVTESSFTFSKQTALLLAKVGFYKIKNQLKTNSPKKNLKQKYNINLSLADTMINRENLNIVYTSRHMAPDSFQSKRDFVFVGPSLFFKKEQSDFPFGRLASRKVVYISLGTLHNNNPSFYDICIKAFRESEYIVVISIGFQIDSNNFSDCPHNFIIKQSVPQQILLKQVDLFITHAGMNSVNEAVCYGVPMLLFPHQFEQYLIAQKVEEMGIGRLMSIKKLTPDLLYKHAYTLINDSKLKKQAVKYKALFNEEEKLAHVKAADEILDYTRKYIPKKD
jgi:MGT family glycosyltransferase